MVDYLVDEGRCRYEEVQEDLKQEVPPLGKAKIVSQCALTASPKLVIAA